MAVHLARILALYLVFLAEISIEQTKSQENSTNTEVDPDYDDVLFDVPENPNEKFNQSFYQKAQRYTASNWRKMTAGTVLNMTLKVTSFIVYYVFSVEILHFAKNFHQRFDDFFRARFYYYSIMQK